MDHLVVLADGAEQAPPLIGTSEHTPLIGTNF